MSGSYIPPHLRNKGTPGSPDGTSAGSSINQADDYLTLEEIHDYFWPGDANGAEDRRFSGTPALGRTLHDSRQTPGKLAFVILFKDANPRWDTDHILFTKSSLELLPRGKPGDHADAGADEVKQEAGVEGAPPADSGGDEEAGHPIAVFKQVVKAQAGRSYKFEGWYKIALIDYLEPNSPELVRMLEQKWTKTKGSKTTQEARSSESWQKSLSLKWAVVKLVKDEVAEAERGVPKIERKLNEEPPQPRKSVNEMLAELRVKDITNTKDAVKDSQVSKAEDAANLGDGAQVESPVPEKTT